MHPPRNCRSQVRFLRHVCRSRPADRLSACPGRARPIHHDAASAKRFATAAADVTVQQILSAITDNGRHLYKFDETRSGCRHWCVTVLSDLESHGVFSPGDTQSFEMLIEELSSRNPLRYPLPTRKGTFYALSDTEAPPPFAMGRGMTIVPTIASRPCA